MSAETNQEEVRKLAQDDANRRIAREAFVKFWTGSLEARVHNLSGCDPKALAYDAAWHAFRAGRESMTHGR